MQITPLRHEAKTGWMSREWPSGDPDRTLVLIFGASSYANAPAPVAEVLAAYPGAHVLGCSTAGEIFDTRIFDDSLSGVVVRFEHTGLRSASAPVADAAETYEAGQLIAQKLKDPELRGVLVLSDGLNVNGSELVRGLNSVLPATVVVTGGLAGDGDRFRNTWVIQDRRLQSRFVTAVGFYGPRVRLGHGSKGGWDIFGPERRVTRARGNVLYELDGRPALALYKEYLGDRAEGLPATGLLFPLSVRASDADEKSLVRTILAIDEKEQSLTFAGDIPERSLAQLMRANFDRLVQGAGLAAGLAAPGDKPDGATLAVAVSCVGRRLVLSERAEEEIEATLDVMPCGTHQLGFYSYGEISPYGSGSCDLHNQTMTLTTLFETA